MRASRLTIHWHTDCTAINMSLLPLATAPALPPTPRSRAIEAPIAARTVAGSAGPRLRTIILAGLAFELILILSFVPAPLVPLTADSGIDEVVPWLEVLGQPIHERLASLSPGIGLPRLATILQMICFFGLFLPYAGALRALQVDGDLRVGRAILLFGALFQVTALASRRLFSNDLFSYIFNGRIMTVYGANPYLAVPARYPQDPLLPLVDWREVPNFYGPLWTLIGAELTRLGGDELGLTLLLFRLVPAAAAIAAGFLIWWTLRCWQPRQAALGAALWAWNPLVVLESGVSGHNDALLALLLVVAAWGLVRRRAVLGLLALTAAALVKYSAAVLGPLYLVVLLRRAPNAAARWRVMLGMLAAAGLAAACFWPFWGGGGELAVSALVSSPARYLNSPAELFYRQARLWLGDDSQLIVERMEFRPWWAAAQRPLQLFLERAEIPIGQVEEDQVVLAINRSDGRWQRVFDPASRTTGYVALSALRTTVRPRSLDADPEVASYETGPTGGAVAARVNAAIRLLGWLVVAAIGTALLWRAATPDHLLSGWLALLTLVYWFVATWFFPWYLIWALAIAALRPRGPLVWALVVWSAAVLTYYGLVTLEGDPALGWLYRWRAVPMFLPPLLVLVGYAIATRLGRVPAALRS